jgi:hypothetical protein
VPDGRIITAEIDVMEKIQKNYTGDEIIGVSHCRSENPVKLPV